MIDAPLGALLDLDAGRLPRLIVRVDGDDVALRAPESLSLADALRLGRLLPALSAQPDAAGTDADHAAVALCELIGPDLPSLTPGQARHVAAFYVEQLAAATERLGEASSGPFAPAAARSVSASPPSSTSGCGSNSP